MKTTTFGRAMLAQWALDPAVAYLNHGTVGATPRRVLAAQQAIRDQIERQPSRFLLREMSAVGLGATPPAIPKMRVAAGAVASFLGARGEDLVFVDNATTGANTVLRSLRFESGDEILVTDLGYGAVTNAARFVARQRGASVRVISLPHPVPGPEAIVETISASLSSRTRLVIVDHVCAESALILPVAAIATACRERGAPLLVDGAHAPGALALDIPALGVDWYTGNLHKWAWAPRSSAILWARPERQAELHPLVISWGLDQGFTHEFDWIGTRDPSPWLAAPDAIAFMTELGVDEVRGYNHALAREAAEVLRERWGTTMWGPQSMIGTMATIALPRRLGADAEAALRLRNALLFEDGIEVAVHAVHGALWLRISAQIYNELGDYERLAEAVTARAGGAAKHS